jgi:DNA-binding MarR family transcriptional regulator
MKAPDASPSAFFQVLKLHQLVYAALETALLEQNLTPAQYTSLSLIRHHAPVTPAELSRKLGITAQSASQTVQSLEARQLISRAAIPDNKRSISLYLTGAGRAALARADRLVLAAETAFFARLKPRDFERLREAIRTLRGA